MNISVTRQSVASTTLFAAAEADALTLLRNHVRAIDNSDDELLKIYLDAAFDYMQTMSDRLLGSHDVRVYVDYSELSRGIILPTVNGVSDDFKVFYRKEDGTYSDDILSAETGDPASANADYLADLEYVIIKDQYPPYLFFKNLTELVNNKDTQFAKGYLKITCTAGTTLSSLPMQYKQAALLLVGHYYNMREAENIGGITMEIKEGVRRLMASVRQY